MPGKSLGARSGYLSIPKYLDDRIGCLLHFLSCFIFGYKKCFSDCNTKMGTVAITCFSYCLKCINYCLMRKKNFSYCLIEEKKNGLND